MVQASFVLIGVKQLPGLLGEESERLTVDQEGPDSRPSEMPFKLSTPGCTWLLRLPPPSPSKEGGEDHQEVARV